MNDSQLRTTGEMAATRTGSTAWLGFAMAVTAHIVWGLSLFPYKWLSFVPAYELNAHRFLWSGLATALLVTVMGQLGEVKAVLKKPRLWRVIPLSTLMIVINSTIYVLAIGWNRVLEVSFGYFLSPLLLVTLGWIFLGERLNIAQKVAVALSAIACAVMVLGLDRVPWLGFAGALSWTAYAFIKKREPMPAVTGFLLECALVSVFSAAIIVSVETAGTGHFFRSPQTAAMLVGTLFFTAVPLVLFAASSFRLPLAVSGLMQYMSPSLQFILALVVFQEPGGPVRLVSFALIWTALIVFTVDMVRRSRAAAG